MTKPQLSIVVPCYNEAENIPLILKRFSEVKGNLNVELILVDNGSTDNSKEILERELQKPEHSFARTVLVPKNIGYGHGIMFGLKHAQGEFLAYTHADMQCDPNDVIRGYKIISQKENPEKYLVKGWRRIRKIIPQILTSCFQLVTGILFFRNFAEVNAQPKIFHREFLNKLNYPPLDFNMDFYVIYKAKKEKLKITRIFVNFPERKYGKSKWAFSHLSKLKTINNFLRYMIKLRFLGERKALEK